MRKKFSACLLVLLAACISGYAAAQNANGIMNMFSGMMRAAIIEHARTEWSKVPPNETSCIEQGLQQQGYSINILVQQGIVPQDPRVFGVRSGCRVSATSLPSPSDREKNIGDISAKPTFDCTKTRTATARIVCLDQAGATGPQTGRQAAFRRTWTFTRARVSHCNSKRCLPFSVV
jgi:hypothetical protein